MSFDLNLCKKKWTVAGSASSTTRTKSCVDCDQNCKQMCGDKKCERTDTNGSATGKYSEFYGIDTSNKKGPFKIGFKCGASLGLGVTGTFNTFNTAGDPDYNCAKCTQCTGGGVTVSADGSASLGCNIDVKGPLGIGFSIGEPKIGELKMGVYVGGTGQKGECKGGLCGHIGMDGGASITSTLLPCINLGWLGSYGLKCSGTLKWCAEGALCTQGGGACTNRCPSCSKFKPRFGCHVGSCS